MRPSQPTFGRHGGVGEAEKSAESIAAEVTLASGSLATNGSRVFAMPRRHRLHGATHRHDLGVLRTVLVLRRVPDKRVASWHTNERK